MVEQSHGYKTDDGHRPGVKFGQGNGEDQQDKDIEQGPAVQPSGGDVVDTGSVQQAITWRQEEFGADLLEIVSPTGRRNFADRATVLTVGGYIDLRFFRR